MSQYSFGLFNIIYCGQNIASRTNTIGRDMHQSLTLNHNILVPELQQTHHIAAVQYFPMSDKIECGN